MANLVGSSSKCVYVTVLCGNIYCKEIHGSIFNLMSLLKHSLFPHLKQSLNCVTLKGRFDTFPLWCIQRRVLLFLFRKAGIAFSSLWAWEPEEKPGTITFPKRGVKLSFFSLPCDPCKISLGISCCGLYTNMLSATWHLPSAFSGYRDFIYLDEKLLQS